MYMHHILLMPLQRVQELPCPCLTRRHPKPDIWASCRRSTDTVRPHLSFQEAFLWPEPTHTSVGCTRLLGMPPHLTAAHAWSSVPLLLSMERSRSFTGSFFVTLSPGPSAISNSISEAPVAFLEISVRELIRVL